MYVISLIALVVAIVAINKASKVEREKNVLEQQLLYLEAQLEQLSKKVDKKNRLLGVEPSNINKTAHTSPSTQPASTRDDMSRHDLSYPSTTPKPQPYHQVPAQLQQPLSEKHHNIAATASSTTPVHDNTSAKPTDLPTTKTMGTKKDKLVALAAQKPSKPHRSSSVVSQATEPDETSIDVVTSLLSSVKNWFTGGNLIVRIGVIVLLIGVVLLLRLASDYFETPIELRLGLVAFGGLVLTAIGLKLSKKRRGYGISLQGAGLATIYLTLFAGFRLFHVLPSMLTFTLLAVLAAVTAFFAVKQNALPLALLAYGGAFFAPLLTATDSGNVVGLFSYYLLINCAIAWIAHFRTWKLLNLLGAGVTFGLAYIWGADVFNSGSSDIILPKVRWQLVGLLVLHLLLYVFIALRYTQQLVAAQQTNKLSWRVPSIDVGLLFGVPVVTFGLLAGLLHDKPYILASASALLSLIYLTLGIYLVRQSRAYRLMTEGTLALGISFLALVIPLALSAQWTAIGWAIQGAALVWLGVRMQRLWSVLFGLALQAVSVGVWVYLLFDMADSLKLAILVIAVAGMVSAYMLRPIISEKIHDAAVNNPVASIRRLYLFSHNSHIVVAFVVLIVASMAVLTALGFIVFDWQWCRNYLSPLNAYSLMFFLQLLGFYGLTRWLNWHEVSILSRLILPLFGISLVMFFIEITDYYPETVNLLTALLLVGCGFIWLGLLWFKQWQQQGYNTRFDQAIWLLGLVVMLFMIVAHYTNALTEFLPMVVSCFGLLLLGMVARRQAKSDQQTPPWFNVAQTLTDTAMLIVPVVMLWVAVINYDSSGQYLGLPYVPVLSLFDMGMVIVLLYVLSVVYFFRQHHNELAKSYLLWGVGFGLLAFWLISSMLVRTLHQYAGTPTWSAGAWQSDMVQTGLTILWVSLSLVLTVLASRRYWREVWLVGIGLLGLVLLKLILVDLSNSAALMRVVSFIVAGLFMLVIGYFAPLPPKTTAALTEEKLAK